jgi:hypothetical protein
MNERDYQKRFVEEVGRSVELLPWLDGSIFFREVPLRYEVGKISRSRDKFMPDTLADFIELDKHGNFHLWEAKLLHSDEFIKGKVVGQLMFYDWLFQTDKTRAWLKLSPCSELSSDLRQKLQSAELVFRSWNILVCGGKGWELAAGVNPTAWTYTTVNDDYLKEGGPALAVYHMFHTKTGFALRSLWHLTLFSPQQMHVDSLEAYVDEGYELPVDEPGVWDMPKNLLLKFVGREHG